MTALSQVAVGGNTPQPNTLETANYVVVGAFAIHKNAVKFTSYVKRQNPQAKFELNPDRNLYYVYVSKLGDLEKAMDEARDLRDNSEFTDAWVFAGALGESQNESPVVASAPVRDVDPVTTNTIENVAPADAPSNAQLNEVAEADIVAIAPTETLAADDDETNGKRFIFNLYRAVDNAAVTGDVEVIDPDKTRKLATYKGNEPVRVHDPNNKSENISLVANVFGYRKVQHDISYSEPTTDQEITKDDKGNIVVPFELVRLQKGDIAVMYNVYFFKDAGVMRPESRYEVNSLAEMLKENPMYKIKIHGHTNGGAPGKVISMGDKSANYFSLNETKEGVGSAKKLSEERAEVIRKYLVNEGVDAKRMQIKAWGGKRPIHDKNSAHAAENVRVEVEILEDK